MNRLRRLLLLSPLMGPAVLRSARASTEPLWPGARYSIGDRDAAVRRGLRFIYRTALSLENLERWAHDYLWLFYSIAVAAADPEVKRMAWQMGVDRARAWRRMFPQLPSVDSGTQLAQFAMASHSADSLGIRDPRMKEQIRRVAGMLSAEDLIGFEPANGPPQQTTTAVCAARPRKVSRGARRGHACPVVEAGSPYDAMSEALVLTFIGDAYGVRLGASLPQVMQWLPLLRPYRGYENGRNRDFRSTAYMVTHVAYVLNDYCRYRLRPEWLPDEYAFLAANVLANVEAEDVELTGEFLDNLRSFGMTMDDERLRAGTEFLLSRQNGDGSWGNVNDRDIYNRYHPTWAAVCGLMAFEWQGTRVTSDEALRRAQAGSG
jgi:hypothetical protein